MAPFGDGPIELPVPEEWSSSTAQALMEHPRHRSRSSSSGRSRKHSSRKRKRRIIRRLRIVALSLIGVLVVAGTLMALAYVQAKRVRSDLIAVRNGVKTMKVSLKDGNVESTTALAKRVQVEAEDADRRSNGLIFSLLKPFPVVGTQIDALRSVTKAATRTTHALTELAAAAAQSPLVAHHSTIKFGGSFEPMIVALRPAVASIRRAGQELTAAQADVARVPANLLVRSISDGATQFRSELEQAKSTIDTVLGLSAYGEKIIAPNAPPVRLLLLGQDPWELRPSGGFIGSYGILELNHGRIHLASFDDATTLPHPDPALTAGTALPKLLGKPVAMTDIGWWPDFPTTASTAERAFSNITGPVDGVMGVTYGFLGDVLRVVGSVKVPGYPDVITADNYADRTLYHIELKRPFDTPRKKFLVGLNKVVFDKFTSADGKDAQRILQALGAALKSRDVQLYFNDSGMQTTIDHASWSGALSPPANDTDFISIADTDYGLDKAAKTVSRRINYRVYWDQGHPMAAVTIATFDFGTKWKLNSLYRSHLRLYARSDAVWKPASAFEKLQTTVGLESGLTTFATEQEIQPLSQGTRTFTYQLPDSVVRGGRYRLFIRPQAGTPRDTYVIESQLGASPVTMQFAASDGDQQLVLPALDNIR